MAALINQKGYPGRDPLGTGSDPGIYDYADPDTGRTVAARDRLGRTPLVIGGKEGACCASFESHAYINLGNEDYKELGGRVDFLTPEGVEVLQKPGDKMRICSFLWVYYGYPTSTYEGSM